MLIAFEMWHLDLITAPTELFDQVAGADTRANLKMLAEANMVGTMIAAPEDDGATTILGIMGAVPKLPGECEVFILSATGRDQYPIEFAKTVKKALAKWRGEYSMIRALGEDTDIIGRWLIWLGFHCEGPVEPGPDGEAMSMWALHGRGGGV